MLSLDANFWYFVLAAGLNLLGIWASFYFFVQAKQDTLDSRYLSIDTTLKECSTELATFRANLDSIKGNLHSMDGSLDSHFRHIHETLLQSAKDLTEVNATVQALRNDHVALMKDFQWTISNTLRENQEIQKGILAAGGALPMPRQPEIDAAYNRIKKRP